MLSMTGCGYSDELFDDYQVSVEIKSLNNRFLEINLRSPSILNKFDILIRSQIKKYVTRGKIDITITIKEIMRDFEITPDIELAEKYYNAYNKIRSSIPQIRDSIRLSNILNAEGVIRIDEKHDTNKLWQATEKSLISALEELYKTKQAEGKDTMEDLKNILSKIENSLEEVVSNSDEYVRIYEERLREKITELVENLDEERVIHEVAIMSTKVDINEEIVRLKSHINMFKDTINNSENESVGRKLDFISQEMHREINTIGSKSNLIEISNSVINMKTELEKIKEQLRNVE